MAFVDFADNGAAGTASNFFENAATEWPDKSFMDIYTALSPVLAKQYVNLPTAPNNPLTQVFKSEAIQNGAVIEDIYIDPTNMFATPLEPSPEDVLKFYDVGMKKQYSMINAMNTGAVSRYTYEINKASKDAGVAGQLGSGIVESLRVAQIACVENQANKVLVSTIKDNVYAGVGVDDSASEAILKEREAVVKTALTMSQVNGTYTQSGYSGIGAQDICVIAPKAKWADLIMDKSGVFHPEYLQFDYFRQLGVNIRMIAIDKFETPVTTAEISASNTKTIDSVAWDAPAGKDAVVPDYVICDANYMRIAPFMEDYIMETQHVGAGRPYDTFFLHMQNCFAYQKSRKAVRLYANAAPGP